MEFTYQSTMQLPASYAVLSEDEMVYTVGGAFELNIDRAAVAQFVTNVISNSIRLAGQYTFQMAFDGLTNMRNDHSWCCSSLLVKSNDSWQGRYCCRCSMCWLCCLYSGCNSL